MVKTIFSLLFLFNTYIFAIERPLTDKELFNFSDKLQIPSSYQIKDLDDSNRFLTIDNLNPIDGKNTKVGMKMHKDFVESDIHLKSDDKTLNRSTIKTYAYTNMSVDLDGNFETTLKEDNISSTILSDNLGNVMASFENNISNRKRVAYLPQGSFVTSKLDGNISSISHLTLDGEHYELKIDILSDEELKVWIIDKNMNKTLIYSPKDAESVEFNILEANSSKTRERVDSATRISYSIRREYTLNQSRAYLQTKDLLSHLRAVEDIVVNPNSSGATCEEIQYLSGDRYIKLLDGEANLTISGETFPMELNLEYKLDENREFSEPKSKNLKIKKGWNLISLPVDINLTAVDSIFSEFDYEKIYLYEDENWIENPDNLDAKSGFWIKSNSEQNISFEGMDYNPNLDIDFDKWVLLGTGSDIKPEDKISFDSIWIFSEVWSKNPEDIRAGSGFWIKR